MFLNISGTFCKDANYECFTVARGQGNGRGRGIYGLKKREKIVLSVYLRSLFAATLSPLMTLKALLQTLKEGCAKICQYKKQI